MIGFWATAATPNSSSIADNVIFLNITISLKLLLVLFAALFREKVGHILEILCVKTTGTMTATGN